MGVLPLQFLDGQTPSTLGVKGDEIFAISGITELNSGGVPKEVTVTAGSITFKAKVRIDTPG